MVIFILALCTIAAWAISRPIVAFLENLGVFQQQAQTHTVRRAR